MDSVQYFILFLILLFVIAFAVLIAAYILRRRGLAAHGNNAATPNKIGQKMPLQTVLGSPLISIVAGVLGLITVVIASAFVAGSISTTATTTTISATTTSTTTVTSTTPTTATKTTSTTQTSTTVIECRQPITPPLAAGSLFDVEANIISPQNCDEIDQRYGNSTIQVVGEHSGELGNLELWVLVRPHRDELFYPQAIDACQGIVATVDQDRGLWNTNARLGRREGTDHFDIIVGIVETDSEIHGLFEEWLDEVCQDPHRSGISLKELADLSGVLRGLDTITINTTG